MGIAVARGDRNSVEVSRRDALVTQAILEHHGYFERLARVYEGMCSTETLRAMVASRGSRAERLVQRFNVLVLAGSLEGHTGVAVHFPSAVDPEATADPASPGDVEALVVRWYPRLAATYPRLVAAAVDAILSGMGAADLREIASFTATPLAKTLIAISTDQRMQAFEDSAVDQNIRLDVIRALDR